MIYECDDKRFAVIAQMHFIFVVLPLSIKSNFPSNKTNAIRMGSHIDNDDDSSGRLRTNLKYLHSPFCASICRRSAANLSPSIYLNRTSLLFLIDNDNGLSASPCFDAVNPLLASSNPIP